MQKVQFIIYSGKEVFANDHFYYPWDINNKAKFCSYLLHYKFLLGDKEKYEAFVKDGRHWNNSHEYKIYKEYYTKSTNITFYDKDVSIPIEKIKFIFKK